MFEKQSPIAFGLLLFLGSLAIAQQPIDVLRANGLAKSGKFFVLPEESTVAEGLVHLQPAMRLVDERYGALSAILQNEYEFQWLTDYLVVIQGQLNDFRVAYNNMPASTPQQRLEKQQAANMFPLFDNEIRMTNSQIELRRKRLVGEVKKEKTENEAKQSCRSFLNAKGQVWPNVESLQKRYGELKADDSVLNALKAFNSSAQAQLKIGPSDDFTKKAKLVLAYEKNYSPDTAPQVKKMTRAKRLDLKKKRGKSSSSPGQDEVANKDPK
jgi:hypothetical protein